MKHLQWIPLLLLTLALAACGDKHDHDDDHDHDHDHHAQGPHGGQIADIGDHEAHLEIITDHGAEKMVVHVLTEENKEMRIKEAPVLTLKFPDGPKTLEGVAVGGNEDGASEYHYRDKSLANEFESGKFRVKWKGKTYQVAFEHDHEHGHEHGHDHDDGDHDHDHEHGADEHGPHDGVVAALKDGAGFVEVKLHDDKGDIELWIASDEGITKPIDMPTDAKITVSFPHTKYPVCTLAVRNMDKNEDEDGVATMRDGKTNYFIFPGESGQDASWLMGAEFKEKAVVKIEAGGKTWETEAFELHPHGHHGDHDHGHDDGE
ncbi:MAG: hypothetical protein QNJ98_08465 [Planctomycetota bacterium]|nr:hypothetical protein [Planctomycetota bacterium]